MAEVIVHVSSHQAKQTENQPYVVVQSKTRSLCASISLDKGDISNYVTFIIMIFGLAMRQSADYGNSTAVRDILAFGLFGFAGGVTNWLAVKMLFDRIPGLIGSGVIPRQFKEIRETVKETIMVTFFDEVYLKCYLQDRSKSLLKSINFSKQIQATMEKPAFDTLLAAKLTELSTQPNGALLAMIVPMFGGVELVVPALKPMLVAFGNQMGEIMMAESFEPLQFISIEQIRDEIDKLMTEKLLLLTPEIVKRLLERVIRTHLGWLVVWGNVFGALIGVASEVAGYGK